jgi:hypothetical protein
VDHAHNHATAPPGVSRLVAAGTLDAELGALLWILVEGGVPLLVCGPADDTDLAVIAAALSESAPPRELADQTRRAATTLRATSLKDAFDILGAEPFNLGDDDIRSLGVVIVIRDGRAAAVHYVRPVERDKEGHLQRRPPAVLATWDGDAGRFEHFAWAMTPELGARVGRTQADFEELQKSRAHTLSHSILATVH